MTAPEVEQEVLADYGLRLAHTVLWRYEAGQTGAPDPVLLWALSRVYYVSFDEMVLLLLRERSARSLVVPAPKVDRASGISDAALSLARLYERVQAVGLRGVIETTARLIIEAERQGFPGWAGTEIAKREQK